MVRRPSAPTPLPRAPRPRVRSRSAPRPQAPIYKTRLGTARVRSRRIVLGVTGSIAAYKAAELARGLIRDGHEVRCAMTEAAAHFVTPMTLATLSRHPVAANLHDPALWDMAHLSWASWAQLVLVAPATADFIARLAHGRAEGLLDALVLSARCPIVVCPAMDAGMWSHAATQANAASLRKYGYEIWGPAEGELASGKVGIGRLLEPTEIVERVRRLPLR